MRIYEVIQEANKFTQARADAIAKSKALAGDYRSKNLADLGDLIKQKQKADTKTQSWRDMKQTDDDALTSTTTGNRRYERGTTTHQQRREIQRYAGIKSKPVGVEPDSSSSPLNTGVRELFNQGMSPSEIEDYLVFQKKIKRNLARKIIDQELYQPASTPIRSNELGRAATTMFKDFHKRKQQQKDGSDDEELTEIKRDPSGKFSSGSSKYGLEGKPDWFDRAVELKKANPDITYADISRAVGGVKVGAGVANLAYWLTGQDRGTEPRMKRSDFPFKPEDFPIGGGYGAGVKPPWYDQALQMAKAGKTFKAIAKEFGVASHTISHWLVKGRKRRGKIINPDAELEPRNIIPPKIDPQLKADVENLIKDPKLEDADIVELIADAYGTAEAKKVKDMLPALRQKLNPGTQVIDKSRTGSMRDPDITGLVQ